MVIKRPQMLQILKILYALPNSPKVNKKITELVSIHSYTYAV